MGSRKFFISFLFLSCFFGSDIFINCYDDVSNNNTGGEFNGASSLRSVLIPCGHNDVFCIQKSFKLFLDKTCLGIPQYDVKAMDPFTLPELEIHRGDWLFHFTNITVHNMKNREHLYKTFDSETKTYTGIMREKPYITANLEVQLGLEQIYHGVYTSEPVIVSTISFSINVRTDDHGNRYLEITSESINIEIETQPNVTVCPPLTNDEHEPELLALLSDDQFNKEFVVGSITPIHVTVGHNIRRVAAEIPVDAFFTDM